MRLRNYINFNHLLRVINIEYKNGNITLNEYKELKEYYKIKLINFISNSIYIILDNDFELEKSDKILFKKIIKKNFIILNINNKAIKKVFFYEMRIICTYFLLKLYGIKRGKTLRFYNFF